MKPNVYVVGFPRGGTTYLYKLLKQHPDVDVGKIKEICHLCKTHFFMDAPQVICPYSRKPFSWYVKNWGDKKVRIDFSISSVYDLESIKRIKEKLGDIKIIFMIRNREDHQKSIYNSMRHNSLLTIKTFEEYKARNHKFLEYSEFEKYIELYKKYFSNVGVFNIVDNDESKEIKKVLEFLNLKECEFNYNLDHNSGKIKHKLYPANSWYRFKRRILIFLSAFFPQLIKPQYK